MYDLILKPVIVFIVIAVMLFVYHIWGPALAQIACPYLGEAGTGTVARCEGFFDLLG